MPIQMLCEHLLVCRGVLLGPPTPETPFRGGVHRSVYIEMGVEEWVGVYGNGWVCIGMGVCI